MTPTRKFLHDFMIQSPLHAWLGCEIAGYRAEDGEVTARLPFKAEFLGDPDGESAHGGIVATLVDLAAHAAVHAVIDRGAPTIDLKVDFLRAAILPLEARAVPLHIGRTIGFVDVEVFDRAGNLAAVGRVLFATRQRDGDHR